MYLVYHLIIATTSCTSCLERSPLHLQIYSIIHHRHLSLSLFDAFTRNDSTRLLKLRSMIFFCFPRSLLLLLSFGFHSLVCVMILFYLLPGEGEGKDDLERDASSFSNRCFRFVLSSSSSSLTDRPRFVRTYFFLLTLEEEKPTRSTPGRFSLENSSVERTLFSLHIQLQMTQGMIYPRVRPSYSNHHPPP